VRGGGGAATGGSAGGTTSGITSPFAANVVGPEPNACDFFESIAGKDPAVIYCQDTATDCGQDRGECCLKMHCLCGKPSDINAQCVGAFDFDLLNTFQP